MREEAVRAIHDAYKIEEECLREMQEYIDDDAYSRAVVLLAAAGIALFAVRKNTTRR